MFSPKSSVLRTRALSQPQSALIPKLPLSGSNGGLPGSFNRPPSPTPVIFLTPRSESPGGIGNPTVMPPHSPKVSSSIFRLKSLRNLKLSNEDNTLLASTSPLSPTWQLPEGWETRPDPLPELPDAICYVNASLSLVLWSRPVAPPALPTRTLPLPAGWAERLDWYAGRRYYVSTSDAVPDHPQISLQRPLPPKEEAHKVFLKWTLEDIETESKSLAIAGAPAPASKISLTLDGLLVSYPKELPTVSPKDLLQLLLEWRATAGPLAESALLAWANLFPGDWSHEMVKTAQSLASDPSFIRRLDDLSMRPPALPDPAQTFACEQDGSNFNPLVLQNSEIASAIKDVDFALFAKVPVRGLLLQSQKHFCSAMAKQFNEEAAWVSTVVLQEASSTARARLIGHFISIADSLRQCGDFHGCLSVMAALGSSDIKNLHLTWSQLDKESLATYYLLQELCDPGDGSHGVLLESHKSFPGPNVPHLGSYLLSIERLSQTDPPARFQHLGALFLTFRAAQQSATQEVNAAPASKSIQYGKAVKFFRNLHSHIIPEEERHQLSAQRQQEEKEKR